MTFTPDTRSPLERRERRITGGDTAVVLEQRPDLSVPAAQTGKKTHYRASPPGLGPMEPLCETHTY